MSRVGWGEAEGWWNSYIDTSLGGQQWGLMHKTSVIKLPAPSTCGIFIKENKCLDHGTVLLHGGKDEAGGNIIPLCAPVGSPGATEPTPRLPGVGIPFP